MSLAKIFGVLGFLMPIAIHAEPYVEGLAHSSYLQIGGDYTKANIKLTGQSKYRGDLGGIQVSYAYEAQGCFYASAKASWKQGRTENSNSSRFLVYVDVQERLGYTFSSYFKKCSATVFSGIGYRYLGHKLNPVQGSSVKFCYNEFYLPLGFLSRCDLSRFWSLGFNFTWMPQVFPTVKISPLKGANWSLVNTWGNIQGELPLTYFIAENRNYAIILKPFYEYWQNGKSTAKTSNGRKLNLPENTYNLWGAEVNLAFAF